MPEFVHRRINITFSQGQGATGQTGFTNSAIKGLRCSARIEVLGEGMLAKASLQIYGMTLSAMNQLATIGYDVDRLKKNTVRVEAGDDANGMALVFEGNVNYAWPDMQAQPQVVFRVEAQGGQFDQVGPKEEKVVSFKGPTKVTTIAQKLANMMGRTFEDNGVKTILNNPYFYGTPMSMMKELGKHARIGWVDENQKTLAIWPLDGQGRSGNIVASKATGMVADPIGAGNGHLIVKMLHSRPVKFNSTVTVQSIITAANGQWKIARIDYSLESETPHGEWFATFECYRITAGAQQP